MVSRWRRTGTGLVGGPKSEAWPAVVVSHVREVEGERGGVDGSVRQRGGAPEGVAQLARVAGPVVRQQASQSGGRERVNTQLGFPGYGHLPSERQKSYVFRPMMSASTDP